MCHLGDATRCDAAALLLLATNFCSDHPKFVHLHTHHDKNLQFKLCEGSNNTKDTLIVVNQWLLVVDQLQQWCCGYQGSSVRLQTTLAMRSLAGLLFVLWSTLQATSAEEDAPACACSPSEYEFQLDFSLICPPVEVQIGPSVQSTFCQISPFGGASEDITDLTPVSNGIFVEVE